MSNSAQAMTGSLQAGTRHGSNFFDHMAVRLLHAAN